VPVPIDEPPTVPTDPAGWAREFHAQVEAVEQAAREFAVRWDEPEGRFVAALLGVMQRLARIAAATRASMEATAQQAHTTTMAELESLRELRRSVEGVKAQTQAVQMLSALEREHAVQRMIERTLPLFAERLQGALVVREARWNAEQARKRYAIGGLVFLGVFLGGYGLSAWARHDQMALADECLRAVVQAGGHTFCVLDQALPPMPTPTPSPTQGKGP
jgi:hypothetical protein